MYSIGRSPKRRFGRMVIIGIISLLGLLALAVVAAILAKKAQTEAAGRAEETPGAAAPGSETGTSESGGAQEPGAKAAQPLGGEAPRTEDTLGSVTE